MAVLTLRGSSVADATLTNACDMSLNATGGVETSKQTTITAFNNFVEILSKGGSAASVASIPTTPTGKGYVYQPGAGTFALGNWSAIITLSGAWGAGSAITLTLRFFKYNGTYNSIGSIVGPDMQATPTKNAWTFTATSMPATTFISTDLLYIDQWLQDPGGAFGDDPFVYESTSSSLGVANDMQITTSNFTPSSNIRIFDGYGGVFN